MAKNNENSCLTQIMTCLYVDLLALSYGSSVGWLSPTLAILKENNTPLKSGPLTTEEISLIGSASCFGGFVASCIYGWIADKFGRKKALVTLGIPQVLGWVLVYFAQNPYYLILSRVFHGFAGGGIFIVIPLFVTEISEDRIRGSMGSLVVIATNLGVLLAYVICAHVDYFINCICLLMITFIFFLSIFFVYESPIQLLRKNKPDEAKLALMFYKRNLRSGDIETQQKLNEECHKLTLLIQNSDCGVNNKIKCSDFSTKAAVKSIVIGIALIIFQCFNGSYAVLSYASLIFKQAGSNLSPNNSAIIVGGIQIAGAYVMTILVDRAGRKFLLLVSAICCAIGLGAFSVYDYLHHYEYNVKLFDFVPLICCSIVIFSANVGLLSLPFVIIPEITPMKIKSIIYSFNISLSWIMDLLTVYFLPANIGIIGVYGIMGIFAICCFIAVIFIGVYIPETKNRSLDEIREIISK